MSTTAVIELAALLLCALEAAVVLACIVVPPEDHPVAVARRLVEQVRDRVWRNEL